MNGTDTAILQIYEDKIMENINGGNKAAKKYQVTIYTDGSASGNPGPGGYGTILRYVTPDGQKHEKELSQGYKHTTNNRMEIMAAIVGLEALKTECDVVIYSDSQYLVNAFNKGWIDDWVKKDWRRKAKDPVKNVDLWQRLLRAMNGHSVRFNWVKGHDGHPENERCDKLATGAAAGEDLIDDVQSAV